MITTSQIVTLARVVRENEILREALSDILAEYTRPLTLEECRKIAQAAFDDTAKLKKPLSVEYIRDVVERLRAGRI